MVLKLENDYFNTADGNAMTVDDRIKEAFAVDGKVNYKGVNYDSELAMRKALLQEGLLKEEDTAANVIKKSASKKGGKI